MARYDITVAGAACSAATLTARHGPDTCLIDAGDSPLRRDAHLENFPGFPAGVNGRQLLDLLAEQAERAGCRCVGVVTRVGWVDTRFAVETAAGERHTATVSSPRQRPRSSRRKQSLNTDECGRTGVDGPCTAGSPGALTKRRSVPVTEPRWV